MTGWTGKIYWRSSGVAFSPNAAKQRLYRCEYPRDVTRCRSTHHEAPMGSIDVLLLCRLPGGTILPTRWRPLYSINGGGGDAGGG
ncbi:hypothetical protein KCP73_07520 [Salmonella enterica subsp. enterica]|nr:hypothetical protein KCP73_07520 [Salmonella enterica subsp. enterica]